MQQTVNINRQPKKRVCVFIDGTWNVEDNNTNVWRMYSLTSKVGSDGLEQTCFCTKGVGTAYGEVVRGGWFGYGLDEIVIQAYEWLVGHYNHAAGLDAEDEVFIFGFSRGAYAARALAGFIADCGIIRPGSSIGVGELFARAQTGSPRTLRDLIDLKASGQLNGASLIERWMLASAMPATIKMVGVWDTVGALVGEKGYLETGLRQPITNEFHALAIDEHRRKFAPTLLTVKPTHHRDLESVEQRWFVGAHANVGGGYNSDLLPQPPLWWLMRKASALGLTFRESLQEDDALYAAVVRDSYAEFAYGWYARFVRRYCRAIAAAPDSAGDANVNETIDKTVFERWRRDAAYRPKNLVNWAAAYRADPATLATSVLAAAPATPVAD